MKCMICGTDMESGGIITEGISAMWIPLSEFQKKGVKKLFYMGGKNIGRHDVIFGQTKIPNAYFCPKCNKVIGIFDIN